MSSFNKSKTIMVTLLACVAFSAHAAWWDAWKSAGDDGNVNTKGNAAAAGAKSQRAIIYVAVVNNTNTVLGSAVLKDKAGKVLYSSTKGKICAIGDVCRLRVNRSVLNKNTTFFFYDTKNNLTSAYMVKSAPVTGAIGYDIGVSMNSLGMYVLNKIQSINPKINYNRIDQDIVTTTLQATPYEELADYYLDLLGNSKDDRKVIATLATQFANNKSIPANPDSVRLANLKAQKIAVKSTSSVKAATPVKVTRLMSSNTQGTLCDETFLAGLDVLSKSPIPYASNVADIANKFLSEGCDKKKSIADQFAELSTQVTTLQATMDDTYNLVAASSQKQTELSTIKAQVDTEIIGIELSTWVSNYGAILAKLKGADGKPRNSITEIVNSYGGVESAIAKNPDIYLDLNSVYANSHNAHIALNNLGGTLLFDNLKVNLNALCQNGNTIVDGVFHIRSYCDAVIASVYTKNAVVAEKFRYAYQDVNKVYEMDPRTKYKGEQHWENIPNSDFDNYEKKLKVISPQTKFFKMIETNDVVANTVNNLQKAGFTVNEWYPDKSKRYLDVSESTASGGAIIKSKYAYQEPSRSTTGGLTYMDNAEIDERIVNVMGVPVPERFFTAKGNDGVAKERNNYGADEAFPWANKSVITDTGTTGDVKNIVVVAEFKFPASGNAAIYADGFHPENTINAVTTFLKKNNGSYTTQTYDSTQFQRQVFSEHGGIYRVSTTAFKDYKLISSGEYFTYMRYTAADGYSLIWAMRTWLEPDIEYVNGTMSTPVYKMYGAPQCMTNDCVTINNGNKLEKLTFKQGPSIEWAYENLSRDNSVFTLKETK